MKKFILMLFVAAPLFAQKVGLPVSTEKNSYTIENSAYSVGYSGNHGIPVWEMHALTPKMLSGGVVTKSEWTTDSRVKGYRITKQDIEGIKLEPVQLFPKTHAMNDAMSQESSYLTSNLVFMSKPLKDSIWERISYSFELLAKQYETVYIYSGTIFDKEFYKTKYLLNNKIETPAYFYRIALYFDKGKAAYKCYKIKNRIPPDYERNCDLEEFAYNIYQLEAETGIDFFESYIDSNFRQDKIKFLESRAKE